MIWLTLAMILAAGVVEAGEFKVVEADSRMMVSCEDTDGTLHDCKIYEPAKFPCYQRMREVIQKMSTVIENVGRSDKYGVQITVSKGWLDEHWNQVVQDCVHGARP